MRCFLTLCLAVLLLWAMSPRAVAGIGDPPDLIVAAKEGDAHKAYAALEHGDDPNRFDDEGRTPLSVAVQHDSVEVVKTLLAGHARVDRIDSTGKPPLFWAAEIADSGIIRILLDAGARVDQTSKDGMTPLMAAARAGDPGATLTLLNAGADVTRVDYAGRDAMSWAEDSRNQQVLAMLRKAKEH
jgi:ankyrin repeat protein